MTRQEMVDVTSKWMEEEITSGKVVPKGGESKEDFMAGLMREYSDPNYPMPKLIESYCRVAILQMPPRERIQRVRDVALEMVDKGHLAMPKGQTREEYSVHAMIELQSVDERQLRELLFVHMFTREMELYHDSQVQL